MHTLNHLKKLFLSLLFACGFMTSIFGIDLWQIVTDGKTNPNYYIIELENDLSIDIPLPTTLPFPITLPKILTPGQKQSIDVDHATIENLVNAIDKATSELSVNQHLNVSNNISSTLTYNYKFSSQENEKTEVLVTVKLCFRPKCHEPMRYGQTKQGFVNIKFTKLLTDLKPDL